MAEISLLDLQPHQVSRDMRGYSVFFYGDPKSGKTTIATRFPNHLLLAFEKGYSAIPGAMAQPINTWSEARKVYRQLQNEDVKKKFETVIVDTGDVAYDLCEKYICANAKRPDGGYGVDSIGDVPFGKGYTMAAKEFDEFLRGIVQMGYGLVIISHSVDKTFKDEAGNEFNQIVPTLGSKPRNIVSRLCDIIGYSRAIQKDDGELETRLFMRGTPRYVAGSRFKYTPDSIVFSYDNLVKAIADAIDKQATEDGGKYVTDERVNLYRDTSSNLDFDELVSTFNEMVNSIIESVDEAKFKEYWQPRIVQITDKYLGKGVKVNQCSREQVEAIDLIVTDLKEFIERESQ